MENPFPGLRLKAFVPVVVLIGLFLGSGMGACSSPDAVPGRKGTIVLIGGALSVFNDEILGEVKASVAGLCAASRRSVPRIAVVPSAKKSLADALDVFENDDPQDPVNSPGYRNWLTRAGFEPVFIPVTQDTVFGPANAAEDPGNVALINSCQVVFLLGGDQGRHAICLLRRDGRDSALLKAIRNVHARGGVVMGTSAGTHILSNPMYGWGESAPTILFSRLEERKLADVTPEREVAPAKRGNCVFLPGAGLLPRGILVDTHFDARGRLGRLVAGVRDIGLRWGIGVDENTALFLRDGRGTVRGEHGVFIVDAASATFSPVGTSFRARDVRVSFLTSGDIWGEVDGMVVSGKPAIQPAYATAVPSSDIFSARLDPEGERENPYETTFVMRELINSREESVEARAYPASSRIWVRFRKSDRTRGFWASPTAFTIEEMALDIDRQPISAAASPEVSDALDLLRARETRFRPPRPTKGVPTSGKSGNGPDGRKKQERKP